MSVEQVIGSLIGFAVMLFVAIKLSGIKQKVKDGELYVVCFTGWHREGVQPSEWTRLEVHNGPYYFKPDERIHSLGVKGNQLKIGKRGFLLPKMDAYFNIPDFETLPRGHQYVTTTERGVTYYLHFHLNKGEVPCIT